MKRLLLVTTALLAATATQGATSAPPSVTVHNQAACLNTTPNYAAASGGFATLDGQIYSPDGTPFIARGINVMGWDQGAAMAAPDLFPGLNFIRLAIYDYTDPAKLAPFIDKMTARGIVVELENHNNGAGNAGGGQGSVFSGQQLATEQAWYSSVASAFKGNPYVWYGTNNEPPTNPSLTALAAWQKTTYDTIRATGNNNPILLQVVGWDAASMNAGLPADVYAKMTNTVIDLHYYGWLSHYNTDQAAVDRNLADIAAGAQRLKSRDGTMPLMILEYGNSTTGHDIDPNGTQVVNAVTKSGFGSAAWAWGVGNPGDGLTNGSGGLSDYGRQVAAYIATSGANGCAQSPIANPLLFDASGNVLPVSGSVADTVLRAMNGGQTSQTDAGDVAFTAALAAMAPVRTEASPQGTFTPPAPPAGDASAMTVSTDFGQVVDTSGAHIMTVTGTGNTISTTSGPQTVTVSGPGNAIRLGAFDDTVTLTSSGNTVDGGGGADTIVLAYSLASKATGTAAQTPILNASLSATGNTIIASAPGMGVLTINGTLALGDKIDMTKALAGTTWNHQPATMWQYMDAAATADGCVVTVGGKVVVRLPGGSPNDNIGPFITGR